MKIKFYFKDPAVSPLQRRIVIAYTNQLIDLMKQNKEIAKAISNNELAIYIDEMATAPTMGLKAGQFNGYYLCKPSIFIPSTSPQSPTHSEMFPKMYFTGQIDKDGQIQLTDLGKEEKGLRKLEDYQEGIGEPYIVDVMKRERSTLPEATKMYALFNSPKENENQIKRLPLELVDYVTAFLPEVYEINSVHTPMMTFFANKIDEEIKRLTEKNDPFSLNKAIALNTAKERALKAALVSERLFSFTTFINYKENHTEKSILEIAKERKNPKADSTKQLGKDIYKCLTSWKSKEYSMAAAMSHFSAHESLSKKQRMERIKQELKQENYTETERNLYFIEAELRMKLHGLEQWQHDLVSQSKDMMKAEVDHAFKI